MKGSKSMFESNKSPRRGVPQGFEGDISQNPLPDFGTEEKKPIDTKIYIIAGSGIAFLMIVVAICVILIGGSGDEENKYTAEDLVDAYVSVILKDDVSTFDKFVYSKAKNKEDVEKFLKSSQQAFADKRIYKEMTKIEHSETDKVETKTITSILGNKVKNPEVLDFDVYYSSDISSEPEVYTSFSFYVGEINGSVYFAYGSSGKTYDIKSEDDEIEEATATEADAVEEEEKEEKVVEADSETMLAVGNPDVGMVNIPSNYVISSYDTSVLSKVESKYAYRSPDGLSSVVIIKFSNKAKNIKKRAQNVTAALIPDYTLVTGDEVSRIPEAYFGYGESGNSRVETYTVAAKKDGFTRVLAIIAPKDSTLFDIWNTYKVDGGFNTLPGESPIANVPDGMKVVGNDAVGYLLVANDFNEDADYNFENSKGWKRGDDVIALLSEKGSPREGIALSEYADYVRDAYLGADAEEWDSGDWFPGAYYSIAIDEDGKSTEAFCFKGKDGINRLMLVYSKGEEAEVSEYYKNYVLPSGINTDMD